MKFIRAIGVVGFKNSGKTGLIEKLIDVLHKNGEKDIAVIKHSNAALTLDPDRDTSRLFTQSSSVTGVFRDALIRIQRDIPPLSQMITPPPGELLIIEGYKQYLNFPRIICAREPADISGLSTGTELGTYSAHFRQEKVWGPEDIEVIADLVRQRGFLLPGIDCGKCGEPDCAGMSRKILQDKRHPRDCVYLAARQDLELRVGGREIPLNPFVSELLGNTLKGLVQSLKGTEEGEIMIRFKP